MGLVDGFPIRITICPGDTEEYEKSMFETYVCAIMPYNEKKVPWKSGLNRGVCFEYQLPIGDIAGEWDRGVFDDDCGFGHADFFPKPWEEIGHENSTYFPDGQVTVVLKMRRPKKV